MLSRRFLLGLILLLAIFGSAVKVKATYYPQETEPIGLAAMEQFERLPYFKNNVSAHQVSSRDKTGANVDYDNYLYTDSGDCVLLDVKGAGEIERFWSTYYQVTQFPNVKIYLNGESTPTVNMTYANFFSGNNSPFILPLVRTTGDPAHYNYLPISFSQSAKVVFSPCPVVGALGVWHSITYHLFNDDAGVSTFTGVEDSSDVVSMWDNVTLDPKSASGNVTLSDTVSINSGNSSTVADISGSGSINSIKFQVTPNDDATLSDTRIKMYWDGELSPSVDVPFGEFFGTVIAPEPGGAYDNQVPVQSLPLGLDDSNNYYSYFPMPYNRSARIIISNESVSNITSFYYEIQYNTAAYEGLGNSAGYFKAQYNSEAVTTAGQDYTILDVDNSKGYYVGTVLTASGGDSMFLEGDERIYVDGSLTPQLYGTGTEDYFNGGFYFANGVVSFPVSGYPDQYMSDLNTAFKFYRFHLSDYIPFNDSIFVGIEHGANNSISANYSSVAFYYALADSGFSNITDALDVGNSASESSHSYTVSGANWSGSQTSYYEGDHDNIDVGNSVEITDNGRDLSDYSEFVMDIDPNNEGVKLRRRLDYATSSQQALVYVDDSLVGTWYDAGSNNSLRWRDSDFEIPKGYTQNKSSVTVKIEPAAGSNWTEFYYWAYSYLDIDPNPPTTGSIDFSSVTVSSITASSTNASDAGSGLAMEAYQYHSTTTADLVGTYSGATSTAVVFSSLAPNTAYYFQVGVKDAAGNWATSTPSVATTTLANVPTALVLNAASSSIAINWGTNSNPNGTEYYAEVTDGANSGWITDTSWTPAGLSSITAYIVTVKARNSSGAETASVSDGVTADEATAPLRSAGSPSGSLAAGTTQTTLSLTTDEAATCKYGTTANTVYASIINTFTTTGGTAHSQTLTGLADGTTYNYYVRCIDGQSNANTADYTISFSVATHRVTSSGVAPRRPLLAPVLAANFPPITIDLSTFTPARLTLLRALLNLNPQPSFIAPGSASAGGGEFTQPLRLGQSHPDIKRLQIFLNAHGFSVAVTGSGSSGQETNYFGQLTKQALGKFQLENNLLTSSDDIAYGYFGPKTRGVVNGFK